MAVSANPTFTPSVGTFSLANGNTAELMLAGNNARQSIMICPQSANSLVNFGATAGTQATGTLTFGANALNTETIAVNTVTLTFVTGASTATNVHIGDTKEDTAAELAAVINASANALLTVATATVDGAVVTITYDQGGTDGNAYALADSSGSVAVERSAATLAGGSSTIGGWLLVANVPVVLDANKFPSIKNDIYIVSATNADKTDYLEGFGA